MTTKNLQTINELLNNEMLCYKKCCNYVAQTNDKDLSTKLGVYANNHRLRFQVLLNYLNSHD